MNALPALRQEAFTYTRLKGAVWCAQGLSYPGQVQRTAAVLLSQLISEDPDKPLVINCQGIVEIDDHAMESVDSALSKGHRRVLFINAGAIDQQLGNGLRQARDTYTFPFGGCTLIHGRGKQMQRTEVEQLWKTAAECDKAKIQQLVRGSYREYDPPRLMSSTPLRAPGIFDARSLISNPESFAWLCLAMAEALEHLLDEVRPPSPKLLAVSLRASPFAAAVGLLSQQQLDIEIVDHLGPKHEILEEYSFDVAPRSASYIYVADFIIGGTELKIAQTYAYTKKASLGGALAIACALPSGDYPVPVKICPLVEAQEAWPDIHYEFGGTGA